jgi:hypothetical protein
VDKLAFQEACEQVIDVDYARDSIGILKEKTLHAVLKRYFEPHTENHEVRIGSYVADIVGEHGIVEIQTAGFDKLRKKLDCFLALSPVTVVYPVAQIKWLSWIDPQTGEVSPRRKSPKRGSLCDTAWELNKIRTYLNHPNLTVQLLFLELCEYRYLNGWSADKKKGSVRCDRIPLALCDTVVLAETRDYRCFLPEGLHEPFTVKEFAEQAHTPPKRASQVLFLLTSIGLLKRCGKRGNAFLYCCSDAE